MDAGRQETDRELARLEQRIKKIYSNALKEIMEKAKRYFRRFEELDKKTYEQFKSGNITQKEYTEWRKNALLQGEHYKNMIKSISKDLVNSAKMAQEIVADSQLDFYAMGNNYANYQIESSLSVDYGFSVANRETVKNLIRDGDLKLPSPKLDIPKALRWNVKKLNSAILQGIIMGDSIPDIAKKLRSVSDMDYKASVRNARTFVNEAENRGKFDSFLKAEKMGIRIKKQWLAVHDQRTRLTHRQLDKAIIGLHDIFDNGLLYPGDPNGKPSEKYNCRCQLVGIIEDYDYTETSIDTSKMGGLSYEEWKKTKPVYKRKKKQKKKG